MTKTPKTGKTVSTGGLKIEGLPPVRTRRGFGQRVGMSIRNSARWYYQPRLQPKS